MKKILSLLTIITLTASSSTFVVSCSNNLSNKTKQSINNLYDKLSNLNLHIGLQELSSGSKIFKDYKNNFLNQINSKLTTDEQKLISIDNTNNNKNLTLNYQTIKLNIGNSSYSKSLGIATKLGFDAQSISDKFKNELIDVKQTGGFKDSENLTKYISIIQSTLKNQTKWNSDIEKNSYSLNFINRDNLKIIWPNKNNYSTWKPQNYSFNLNIGSDKVESSLKIEFKYSENKKVLDNPNIGDKDSPFYYDIPSGNIWKASEWNKYKTSDSFRGQWEAKNGITPDLNNSDDVKFKPVDIVKGKTCLCEMYIPILGYTTSHPRYFYIEGN